MGTAVSVPLMTEQPGGETCVIIGQFRPVVC
jgi:hypothetical protein